MQVTPPTPPLAVSDKYDAAEPRRQLVGITEEVDVIVPNESRHPHYSRAPKTNFGMWRKNSWITKPPSRRRRSTVRRLARATPDTTTVAPHHFVARSLVNERDEEATSTRKKPLNLVEMLNLTDSLRNEDSSRNVSREVRELILDDNLENLFPVDSEDPSRSWQSKEHITREMEDVFLQGASQALTKYIERQLHPAIKETLMLSMGYTISYG